MNIQWSGLGLFLEYPCMRRSFQWNSYRRCKHVNRPWHQRVCRSFRHGPPRLRLPIGKWTSMDQSRDKFITHLECKCYRSQGDLDRWMKLLLSFRLMRAPQIWDSRLTHLAYLSCVRNHNVKGMNKSHPDGRELIAVFTRQWFENLCHLIKRI